jgi:hypothetical protein
VITHEVVEWAREGYLAGWWRRMSAAPTARIRLAEAPSATTIAAQNSPLATRLVRSASLVGGAMICGQEGGFRVVCRCGCVKQEDLEVGKAVASGDAAGEAMECDSELSCVENSYRDVEILGIRCLIARRPEINEKQDVEQCRDHNGGDAQIDYYVGTFRMRASVNVLSLP